VLNSSGTITEVFERYQNQDFFETNGLDLELSYRRPLADILPIKSNGELNLHILANYVGKLALTTRDGSVTDPAGQYTSPNWSDLPPSEWSKIGISRNFGAGVMR